MIASFYTAKGTQIADARVARLYRSMHRAVCNLVVATMSVMIPMQVSAQGVISGNANNVAGWLLSGFMGGGFVGIALQIMTQARNVIVVVGVFIVVRAGLKLINSQDEDKLTRARRTIASTVVGIMLSFLAERLVSAFYLPGGAWNAATAVVGANILSTEIAGIIDWVLVLIVVISILMIVASALKAVGSFGKEENAAEVKRTIAGVVTGIGLILLSGAFKIALGLAPGVVAADLKKPDASIIILKGVLVVQAILEFLALLAFAVIIYAAILMIVSIGNEEQFKKGKDIIFRAIIGLVVVLLSVAIVKFVMYIIVGSAGLMM